MKRLLSLCLSAAVAGTGLSSMAQSHRSDEQPQKVELQQTATLEGTVKAIDHKHRVVTLEGTDGNTARVKVSEDAPNFDKLKKGDKVTANFYESVALSLAKPDEPMTTEESQQVTATPAQGGQGPTRTMVDTRHVTATIDAIDKQSREVTLKGPEGNTVKVKAQEGLVDLDKLKVGDKVKATITDAVGISIRQSQSQ